MINLLLLILALAKPIPNINYDVSVTALKLYQDYKNNKDKADKIYNNKRVFLHGIVKEESANMTVIYLVIPAPGDGITAVLDDEAITKVPIYKPGDKFDLVCIGASIVFDYPLLLHCKPLN